MWDEKKKPLNLFGGAVWSPRRQKPRARAAFVVPHSFLQLFLHRKRAETGRLPAFCQRLPTLLLAERLRLRLRDMYTL